MKNCLLCFAFLILVSCCTFQDEDPQIIIHYLGHSSFLIIPDDGPAILTDYGKPNAWAEYGWDSPVKDIGGFKPAICTYSHFHDDHYDPERIPGGDCIIIKSGDSLVRNDLKISLVPVAEDDYKKPDNQACLIEYKGTRILHLGDCQANIFSIDSAENMEYVRNMIPGGCDIVLLPIEGKTGFIPHITKFISAIHPSVVIPMHYWSDEYKNKFLDACSEKKENGNPLFHVTKSEGPQYIFSKKEKAGEKIEVISLEVSSFPGKIPEQ